MSVIALQAINMDILLTRNYKYTVDDSLENVRINFARVTNTPGYTFSNNITGTLKEDDTFKLTHKWAFGYIRGFGGNSLIYLTGKIESQNDRTIINTLIRPNIGLTFFLYVLTILFICEVLGIKTMLDESRFTVSLLLLLFMIILTGVIYLMTNGLNNRFERILQLQRDE